MNKKRKMEMVSNSPLQEDIQSLNNKIFKVQFNIINEITKKATTKQYSKQEINEFLQNSKLEQKLEKIIYVNLVNSIKSNDLVIKILQSGDNQMMSDTLRKCIFFFSDTNFTPEFYIDEILPKISYTNRNKLFKIVAKNSTSSRNENFYTNLDRIYKNKIATTFLPYCTIKFIFEKLHLGVKLNGKDLLLLSKTNNGFVIKYLEELCILSSNNTSIFYQDELVDYDDLIQKLLPTCPKQILELNKNYKNIFNFPNCGRRSSKRIIKGAKQFVILNSNEIDTYLKSSQLHRYLNPSEFSLFYQHLMPDKKTDFNPILSYQLKKHLKYYKKNYEKLELLMNCYLNRYGKNLISNLNNISPEILILFPPKERIELAKKKIEKGGDKYLTRIQWTKFLSSDISIEKFRNEIYPISESTKRFEIIKLMVETCGINQDYNTLFDVLKYFKKSHRNEFVNAFHEIFPIIENYFDLNEFDEVKWQEILSLFLVWLHKDNSRNYRDSSSLKRFIAKSIEYAIKNKFELKPYLYICMKWIRMWYSLDRIKIFENNKEWEKLCLIEIGKLAPDFNMADSLTAHHLLVSIDKWNKENPNDTLSIMMWEWLVKFFDQTIENNQVISNFVCKLEYDDEAKQYYQPKLLKKTDFHVDYIKHLIKWNNELIKIGQDQILEQMFCGSLFNRSISPYFQQLLKIDGIEKFVQENCLKYVNDVECNKRPKALRFVVQMNWLNNQEYYDFTRDIHPIKEEIEVGTIQDEKIVKFRKSIIYCLKYFKNDPEALKVIKLYTQGDYLKFCIGTLNNMCTKLPCNVINDFLLTCMDSPVSFKKHVIRLKCLISKYNDNLIFLKEFWNKENNPTIRNVLMKLIISHYLKDYDGSNEFVWECIQSLNYQDKSLIEKLHIPIKYISKMAIEKYLEYCWPLVNKITSQTSDVRRTFLDTFENYMEILDSNFIELLLENFLFKLNIQNHKKFITLSITYILVNNTTEISIRRLYFVIKIMQEAIKKDWDTLNEKSNPQYILRNLISTFCIQLSCKTFFLKNETSKALLEIIQNELNAILKDPEIYLYDAYWIIKFTNLMVKSNKNIELFGNDLRHLITDSKSNSYILLTKFIKVLKEFTNKFFENNITENQITLIKGILIEPINEDCALISINLIKEYDCKNKYIEDLFKKLLELNIMSVTNEINYKFVQ